MAEKKEKKVKENCHMLITSPLNEGGRDKNRMILRVWIWSTHVKLWHEVGQKAGGKSC